MLKHMECIYHGKKLCSPPRYIINFRDRSQKLVKGAGRFMQNFSIAKIYRPHLKNCQPPHVNSIFTGKFVVIFSRPQLQGSKMLRASLFASGPPQQVFVNGSLSRILLCICVLRVFCDNFARFVRNEIIQHYRTG